MTSVASRAAVEALFTDGADRVLVVSERGSHRRGLAGSILWNMR